MPRHHFPIAALSIAVGVLLFLLLATVAASQEARAIPPVLPVSATLLGAPEIPGVGARADSRVPTAIKLEPIDRRPARAAIREARPSPWLLMSAGVYTAAALDVHLTRSLEPNFKELDPLARPFVGMPAPAYYAAAGAIATGANFLGYRMARSERWHKVWWLPQMISIGGNLGGYSFTLMHDGPVVAGVSRGGVGGGAAGGGVTVPVGRRRR